MLGGVAFPTKEGMRLHASIVLTRSDLGEVRVGADESFARNRIAHHPDGTRKQGVGDDVIVVALIAEWGTRNFLVLRGDGTVDNWSIKKCINNLRPDGRTQ